MPKRLPEENRKVQLGLTVKKWIKEKLEKMAEENEISMSKYVTKAIEEKLERDGL